MLKVEHNSSLEGFWTLFWCNLKPPTNPAELICARQRSLNKAAGVLYSMTKRKQRHCATALRAYILHIYIYIYICLCIYMYIYIYIHVFVFSRTTYIRNLLCILVQERLWASTSWNTVQLKRQHDKEHQYLVRREPKPPPNPQSLKPQELLAFAFVAWLQTCLGPLNPKPLNP